MLSAKAKIKNSYLLMMLIISLSIALVSCGKSAGPAQPPPGEQKQLSSSYELRWGTAPAGGAFQVLGSAMLEDIKKSNPEITGSILPTVVTANLMGIHEGKVNIAFSLSDTTADAWEGKGFFAGSGQIQDLRNIATLYKQGMQWVVPANSAIKGIEDLKGKRVSPGSKGLSADLEAQRILKLYNMSYEDMKVQFLDFNDAAQQFIDGHLDALLFTTMPYPFAPIVNVASQKPIRLLSLPEDKVKEMTKYRGVEPFTLPAGIYKGVDYPVTGIAVRVHLVVDQKMPEEVVYKIVKAIAENLPRYGSVLPNMKTVSSQDMVSDVGIPFHPGALKFYREQGWVK